MNIEQKRWDTAAPQPLKYVMSDGTLLDSLPTAGETITPSPNRALAKRWSDAAPVPAKWVNSDGAIVDKIPTPGQEDTPVIAATRASKKLWDDTPAQISKYLKSDGTITDSSSSGDADLEDNKEATIDVSTYTEPVEITPTAGKNGMKKATVTLSNIPNSGATLYGWKLSNNPEYLNVSVAPSADSLSDLKILAGSIDSGTVKTQYFTLTPGDVYTRVSDTEFTITHEDTTVETFTRNTEADVQLWG